MKPLPTPLAQVGCVLAAILITLSGCGPKEGLDPGMEKAPLDTVFGKAAPTEQTAQGNPAPAPAEESTP